MDTIVKGNKMTVIIAILNQKGGVGKTTIVSNLGEAFKREGKSVLLVDADPQGSLRDWNEASEGAILPVIALDRKTIESDLKQFMGKFDLILIDGAPQSGVLAAAAIASADIVLIPVTPSPYDVWACRDIVDFIEQRKIIANDTPIARFIISRAIKNTKLSGEVVAGLEDYKIETLSARTVQRQAYALSASEGLTVFHTYNKNAIEEIKRLRESIEEVIENGIKSTEVTI